MAPGQDKVAQTAELQLRAAGTMVAAPGGSARPEDPGPVVWPLVGGESTGGFRATLGLLLPFLGQ